MSMDDYENCLTAQYNLDREAVEFIVNAIAAGGQDVLQWLKDHWATIAGAAGILTTLGKLGGAQSLVVKFLQAALPALAAAVIDALAAVILGLGLAAVLLAIEAGIECLPKLQQSAA